MSQPDINRAGVAPSTPGRWALLEPLRVPVFRRIWSASLPSNLAQQSLIVIAAWTMAALNNGAHMVAMVQTASMLPIILIALPAGAIADFYDRRRAAIAALSVSIAGAALLFIASLSNAILPWLLLVGCFVAGCGFALFSPAWQASVGEYVGREALPAAVALYGVAANLARSGGPALGGILVAWWGVTWAFGLTALCYLPMLTALITWQRKPSPIASETRIWPAIRQGLVHVASSPPVRSVILRCLAMTFGASSILALVPLVAKETLKVGPQGLGFLLGAFGLGGVCAIFFMGEVRQKFGAQRLIMVGSCIMGLAVIGVALSVSPLLSALILLMCGSVWMLNMTLFNVGVQISTPVSIIGRALSIFQATSALGIAAGASSWGFVAARFDVKTALVSAGVFLLASSILPCFMPARPSRRD